MSKTIIQEILFKNTTPNTLYNLYMNANKHSDITGSPAVITEKEGDSYSAHGGYITGKNLLLVKDKLIVQTWRAQGWEESDVDSIFMIKLEPQGEDVILHAIHANLPDNHAGHIDQGWHDHYWNPWKQYLAGETITLPKM
ncbi:MAG TPA: SRPBCC domain-containing protein [Saprospiraceae bacterium]|nr:SRPBCC domain-containing protein [Saprospiraceae bacterium]